MQTVALIDYGSGNLRSAEKALVRAADGNAEIVVTNDPARVADADRVVLPGVGAFAACMSALSERIGVIEAMGVAVIERGVPLVTVFWPNDGIKNVSVYWDTHSRNFNDLKDRLIPVADKAFSALRERHDRGRQAAAFRIGDDNRFAAFHDRDDRVGSAQIDADDFAH